MNIRYFDGEKVFKLIRNTRKKEIKELYKTYDNIREVTGRLQENSKKAGQVYWNYILWDI